jgi:hypothetical protein
MVENGELLLLKKVEIVKNIGYFIIGLIVGAVTLFIVKKCSSDVEPQTEIRIDTVYVKTPVAVFEKAIAPYRFAEVPQLLTLTDTVFSPYYVHDTLIIPVQQRYYAGEGYKAWVSGYNPKLDSIVVYNTTITHTVPQIKEKVARNALSVEARFLAAPDLFLPSAGLRYSGDGLFAEIGVLYYQKFSPYVGIGYSVTLFRR